MAQGLVKLVRKTKSGAAQKKATKARNKVKKGANRQFSAKKAHKKEFHEAHCETSKAIAKKNEQLVAAKAVNVGAQFFLSDLSKSGQTEASKQRQQRDKKQGKSNDLKNRLNMKLHISGSGKQNR